jgi:nondiscriminating aspartyl-tRNA synthetase
MSESNTKLRRILSLELKRFVGERASMAGWVHRIREIGQVHFITLRDRQGLTQIVVPKSISLANVTAETVIKVAGTVKAEPRAKSGFEMHADALEVIGHSVAPPIDIYRPNVLENTDFDTLIEHRPITLRIPQVLDVFRAQAVILSAFRRTMDYFQLTEINTPKLVTAGAEGGAALFAVEYYGKTAYLAQSPQVYKQMMVGSGLERVYEVGKVYRAEKSNTTRHLTEFVGLDVEMGFIEGMLDVQSILESVMLSVNDDLMKLGVQRFYDRRIPHLTFTEARDILKKEYGHEEKGGDLSTEGERMIGEWAVKNKGEDPTGRLIFIDGYEASCRPFYTKRHEDGIHTKSFDLLLDGVEIATGGQRINEYDELVAAMKERGLNPDEYGDYLSIFRHGMPPHGGFGLGLERLTKQILGLPNVKQASLFPRDTGRLRP